MAVLKEWTAAWGAFWQGCRQKGNSWYRQAKRGRKQQQQQRRRKKFCDAGRGLSGAAGRQSCATSRVPSRREGRQAPLLRPEIFQAAQHLVGFLAEGGVQVGVWHHHAPPAGGTGCTAVARHPRHLAGHVRGVAVWRRRVVPDRRVLLLLGAADKQQTKQAQHGKGGHVRREGDGHRLRRLGRKFYSDSEQSEKVRA